MTKAEAQLIDPESGSVSATFTETCHPDGSATAEIVLKKPIELQGTQRLEVYGAVTSEVIISVGAKHPSGTKIHEFSGKSALGCLPDEAAISLVRTPGGDLGTLLLVLGTGTIRHRH